MRAPLVHASCLRNIQLSAHAGTARRQSADAPVGQHDDATREAKMHAMHAFYLCITATMIAGATAPLSARQLDRALHRWPPKLSLGATVPQLGGSDGAPRSSYALEARHGVPGPSVSVLPPRCYRVPPSNPTIVGMNGTVRGCAPQRRDSRLPPNQALKFGCLTIIC